VNRIILEPAELSPDGHAVLRGRRARHIATVLRATPGQTLRIGVVNGPTGEADVLEQDEDTVRLACTLSQHAPPAPLVSLLLALPRPKVMRRLWRRLASVGVGSVILTNAERVERNYFDTHWLSPETYRPLLLEGLEQSGDTHLPGVVIRRRLKVFIEDELDTLMPDRIRLIADPRGESLLATRPVAECDRVLLAVGPEGGWTPYERDMFANHGFGCVGFGRRILRSDDACVALLAVLNNMVETHPTSIPRGEP